MAKRKQTDFGKIEILADVAHGKPVVAGTRIQVEQILEFLANGWSEKKIIAEYPTLHKDDIRAVMRYASQRIKREEIRFVTQSRAPRRVSLSA